MQTPFPGMDPYLEHPDVWHDVHQRLIVVLANTLAPVVQPRYRIVIEKRTYRVDATGLTFVGRPDVATIRRVREAVPVYAPGTQPLIVEIPVPDIIEEGYLEVRDVVSGNVVTVLELLSPANKRPGKDRRRYEHKRLAIFDSSTHLVEIDLLRGYKPMPVYGDGQGCHYRILVSRSEQRPRAELYGFSVRNVIPTFPLPLRPDDEEPLVDLNGILHDLYELARYDLSIDYRLDPVPPLEGDDAAWVAEMLAPLHERPGS